MGETRAGSGAVGGGSTAIGDKLHMIKRDDGSTGRT